MCSNNVECINLLRYNRSMAKKAPEKKAIVKKTADKRPKGRPSKFTDDLAKQICLRLSMGETLRRICRDDGMPAESTVRQWALDDVQGFYAQYVRARDIGLDAMADEILDIADDGENDYVERERKDGSKFTAIDREHVQRSSLRVDTRKWYLSKMAPKRYDKPDTTKEPEKQNSIPDDYKILNPDESVPDAPVL